MLFILKIPNSEKFKTFYFIVNYFQKFKTIF